MSSSLDNARSRPRPDYVRNCQGSRKAWPRRLYATGRLRTYLCFSILLAVIPLVRGPVAWASSLGPTAAKVMVTPTRIQARLLPGVELPVITVANHGGVPVEIRGYLGKGGHDLNGMPLFQDGPFPEDYPLSLSPGSFILPAGQERRVQIANSGELGETMGLYPIAYFEVHPVGARTPTGAVTRIAVLTLLTGSKAVTRGELVDVIVEETDSGELDFRLLCKNTGDVHLQPAGRVRLIDSAGSSTEYPVDPAVILPGYARYLHSRCAVPADGQHIVEATLFDSGVLLGKLRLALSVQGRRLANVAVLSDKLAAE